MIDNKQDAEKKLMPNKGESVYNLLGMSRVLSSAINNYQKVFGLQVDIYRIEKREVDKLVKVYGPSQVSLRDPKDFKFLKTIRLLTAPTEFASYLHQNSDEVEIKLGTPELKVGDMVRIHWVGNETLDYFVAEVPKTVANIVWTYKLVSQFTLNTQNIQRPGNKQK